MIVKTPALYFILTTALALPLSGSPETSPPLVLSDANYRITAGDLIMVKVFREDDLLTTARVTEEGTIALPLIGNVRLQGLTDGEAARLIRDRLDARFLVNPSVTVTVTGHGKRTFTVLGQVQKPGVYNMQYRDRLDLLQACGMAGGYTRFANASKIVIKRTVAGKESVYTADAARMAANKTETFQVLPGDTITVPESAF